MAGFIRRRNANAASASGVNYRVVHTDVEWRRLLSPAAYQVLRQAGTEAPFYVVPPARGAGRYLQLRRLRAAALFSATKYDSGTGWPSFWDHLPGAILTSEDNSFGMQRTEVHCSQCGGHVGHVFPDGPQPTGLRYCMNGVALSFTPRKV